MGDALYVMTMASPLTLAAISETKGCDGAQGAPSAELATGFGAGVAALPMEMPSAVTFWAGRKT